jgi:hypothetical protein
MRSIAAYSLASLAPSTLLNLTHSVVHAAVNGVRCHTPLQGEQQKQQQQLQPAILAPATHYLWLAHLKQ